MSAPVYIHPFEPFIPEGATTLIIGSIPPARFCSPTRCLCEKDVDFYYGSKDNAFWDLVGKAMGRTFSRDTSGDAVEDRKNALTQMRMGITDVIATCRRKNGSALDSNLKIEQCKRIDELLVAHPTITRLLYTSAFVKSKVGCILKQYHRSTSQPREWRLPFDGRTLAAIVLYSPSPRALAGMGAGGADKRMQQYCRYFSMR